MARKLSSTFDELAQQYFGTPEGFAKAIKLLQEYKTAETRYPAFEDFQRNFLDQLDDITSRESELLEKAFNYVLARSLAKDGATSPNPHREDRKWIQEQLDRLEIAQATIRHHEQTAGSSLSLADAVSQFIGERRYGWKANSGTEEAYTKEVFPLFLEINGNIQTAELRKDHVIAFKTAVLNLPKNRRKMPEYRDLSIQELAHLSIPESKQISGRTKSYYLAKLASFLAWLEVNGYAASSLNAPLKRVIRTKTRAQDERNAYTDSDLTKLFNSDCYTSGLHRYSFQFWVPLIGLFTGARENEICQLFVGDIYQDQETGIWVIDFNENDSKKTRKSLKRPTHARQLPIHPQLIKLGFLDFVEQRRKQKTPRLFPELPYRANKYADKNARWFNNTYTRKCGIKTPKTSFHSLRHTMINYLSKQLKMQSNEFAYYVAHSPSGNQTDQRYNKPLTLKEFYRRYRSLTFDRCVDFKAIRPWRSHLFSRQ